ncbi:MULTISPECIES: hypothetical protein [unclassified Rhodosalinus]|uniref:hypothetical protein n=1 Tax=unclassified Rhodosalinus TaxID=2630183 RepID=UPI003524DCAF
MTTTTELGLPRAAVLAVAAAAALAGCAMPPENVSDAQLADYDLAVASIGCELRYESDYAPVELQAGLTRQQVLDISQYRLASDQAVRTSEGGVRLVSGPCAPAA